MNSTCIVYFFLLGVVSVAISDDGIECYSAENIWKFAEYLYQEGDYLRAAKEYERYLSNFPQGSDNTLYKIGLCYRLGAKIEESINSFNRILEEHPESHLKSDASYQIAYSYFLSGRYGRSIKYLDRALSEVKDSHERGKLQILMALNYLHQRQWISAGNMLDSVSSELVSENKIVSEIKALTQEGMRLSYKNPTLAGIFSAIVPGTGRMYCKQYGDGFYSFVLIGISGLLAWEGFRENGVRSIKGWSLGSLCAIFYAGNIYGSSISARVYNHQLETDLLRRLPKLPDN